MERNTGARAWGAVTRAFVPGLKTACWMLKLMVPITLGVAVLDYLGVIETLSKGLTPLFSFMGLDGRGALVFMTSVLVNIYSAIAVMAGLNLDLRSVTILATMCLIAHNLVIETAVQHKTGSSTARILLLRLGMALLAGVLLNLLLPEKLTGDVLFDKAAAAPRSWGGVFLAWGRTLWGLLLKMVPLVIGLNILQNLLREFRIIDWLTVPLKPVMKLFGLPYPVTFLWIVANTLGLAYGGAVMIAEADKGELDPEDIGLLNTHIALSHSMLEDTILFAVLGVGVGWLILPRLTLAVAAVWVKRLLGDRLPALRRTSR